jgi:hypothetical protein
MVAVQHAAGADRRMKRTGGIESPGGAGRSAADRYTDKLRDGS